MEDKNKTYKLVENIIESGNYKVIEKKDGYIAIRYKMNNVSIWTDEKDTQYLTVILSGFTEDVEDNDTEAISRCYNISSSMKVVKSYIIGGRVLLAYEFNFKEKEDLAFHLKKSLDALVSAKISYLQLERLSESED